jgi:hypothetical protein
VTLLSKLEGLYHKLWFHIWNAKRQMYENDVLEAVERLSNHVGTNCFNLPFNKFDVKVNYDIAHKSGETYTCSDSSA